jgi:hypothetical protein
VLIVADPTSAVTGELLTIPVIGFDATSRSSLCRHSADRRGRLSSRLGFTMSGLLSAGAPVRRTTGPVQLVRSQALA